MSKRAVDDFTASGTDSGLDDALQRKKKKKSTRTRKPAPALYKARVTSAADTVRVRGSTEDIGSDIMQKMRKCYEKANHSATSEGEGKAAIFLLSKLMKRYNVTQADILAHASPEERRKSAGESKVAITRRDEDKTKPVQQNVYIWPLIHAITNFFQAKAYTLSNRSKLVIVFYGIADNTAGAARAFEMVFNLCGEWGRRFKGTTGRNSYALGIANELSEKAIKEQEEEETRAKEAESEDLARRVKEEKMRRQAELDRLAELPTGTDYVQPTVEDDDSDAASLQPNVDMLNAHSTVDPSETKLEPSIIDLTQDDDEPDIASSTPHQYVDDDEEPEGYSDNNDSQDEFEILEEDDDEANYDEPNVYDESDDEEDGADDGLAFDLDERIESLAPGFDQEPAVRSLLGAAEPGRGSDIESEPIDTGSIIKSEPIDTNTIEPLSTDGNVRKDSVDPTEIGEDDIPGGGFRSHMQLMTFREDARKIADDYLKEKFSKLRKARKREMKNLDREAYRQGQKDSKKINVHTQLIDEK